MLIYFLCYLVVFLMRTALLRHLLKMPEGNAFVQPYAETRRSRRSGGD